MEAQAGRALNGLVRSGTALGLASARALGEPLRDRAVGAAFSNLKLSLIVLLSGMGFVIAVVCLPVLMIVFTLSAGISHGLTFTAPAALPADAPLAAGKLTCPVPGAATTQPFGPSVLPGEPAMFGYPHFHTGVDLAVAEGTPIRAAESGQVVQAAGQTDSLGFLVGYGNLVRVAASTGRAEYYGHLSAFAVSRGDIVQQGQVIGYVGTTGYSTGPHVHFEVRINNVPVDPVPFMQPC